MASRVPVYQHPLDGSSLLPVLKSLLPKSLPIYRRLQFPHRSASSYLLASFEPGLLQAEVPLCFCIAFIDRSRRPETEGWVFVSGEVDGRCAGSAAGPASCELCKSSYLSVLQSITDLPLPYSVHAVDLKSGNGANRSSSSDETRTAQHTEYLRDETTLLLGSLSDIPVEILKNHGLIRHDYPGLDIYYQKYIFPMLSVRSKTVANLPPELHWGEVRTQDFALIKSRTQIQRQDKTLAILPSIAILSNSPDTTDQPVAWCFLGPDASLTTLHVEPDWRGKGLAKAATIKLWNEKLKVFEDEEGNCEHGWLAHSDVHIDNIESRGVAKSLGGTEGWMVRWIRVDLHSLRTLTLH